MGAMQEKLIEVSEHGFLLWEEVPHDLLVKLGIEDLAPESGPILGPDDRLAPSRRNDATERQA